MGVVLNRSLNHRILSLVEIAAQKLAPHCAYGQCIQARLRNDLRKITGFSQPGNRTLGNSTLMDADFNTDLRCFTLFAAEISVGISENQRTITALARRPWRRR
jgi:hypothetical protein